jgi:hypothetical protein
MPDAIEVNVVHLTHRRLRIKIPAKRHDEQFFATARQHLSERPGVQSVEVNPTTASILIHTSDARALLQALGRDGRFTIAEQHADAQESNPLEQVRHQLAEWDKQLQEWTGVRHGARAYIFIALVLAAAFQFARGEIFAPASVLLWYAGEALRLWIPSDKAGSGTPAESTELNDAR